MAQRHFNGPSPSFLTNEDVNVWPDTAAAIFPAFYREDAGRSQPWHTFNARGGRPGAASEMECVFLSHLSVNIQIALPTAAVCAEARSSKRHISVTFFPTGIDDKSMGFSGSLLITIIIIYPLTTGQLLHDSPLVAA